MLSCFFRVWARQSRWLHREDQWQCVHTVLLCQLYNLLVTTTLCLTDRLHKVLSLYWQDFSVLNFSVVNKFSVVIVQWLYILWNVNCFISYSITTVRSYNFFFYHWLIVHKHSTTVNVLCTKLTSEYSYSMDNLDTIIFFNLLFPVLQLYYIKISGTCFVKN